MKNSKDTIVSVALRVFGRLGVYKTTMNDIAQASKKGRRTIYQYFKSKEEVYEAVLVAETANMTEPMKEIAFSDKPTNEKLSLYAYQRIKSIERIAKNHKAFKIGFINNDKVIKSLRRGFDNLDTELLIYIIEEGKKNKTFSINDTLLVVKNFQTALRGMEIEFIRKKLSDDCKIQLDNFINIFFNGILNKNNNLNNI